MNPKALIITSLVMLFSFGFSGFAQTQSEAEQEKQLYDSIQKLLEDQEAILDLESWQVFLLDSIYVHDYNAMNDELKHLNKTKVSNQDLYIEVQDKWMEQIYQQLQSIFNEDQWKKYLKGGAAAEKKARDKRAAKRASK